MSSKFPIIKQPDSRHLGSSEHGSDALASDASALLLAQAMVPPPQLIGRPDLAEPPGGNATVKNLRREIDIARQTRDHAGFDNAASKLAALDQERLKYAISLNNADQRQLSLPILLSLQVDEGSGDEVLNQQLAIARYGRENLKVNPDLHLHNFKLDMNKASLTADVHDTNLKQAKAELLDAEQGAQRLDNALAGSNKVLASQKQSYAQQINELDHDNATSDPVKTIEKMRLTAEIKYIDSLLPEGNHAANTHYKNISDLSTFLHGIVKYREGNDADAHALFTNFSELLKKNPDLATNFRVPANFNGNLAQYVDFLSDETKDRGYLGLGNWWHKHREEVTRGLIFIAGTAAGLAAGVATFCFLPPAAPLTGTAVEGLVVSGLTATLALSAADAATQGLATAEYDGDWKRGALEGGVGGAAIGVGIAGGAVGGAVALELLGDAAVAGEGLTMLGKYGPRIASGLAYATVHNVGTEAIRSSYHSVDNNDGFSWNNVMNGIPQDVAMWTALGGTAPSLSAMFAGRGAEPVLASLSKPWGPALEWTLRTDASKYLVPPVAGPILTPVTKAVSNAYWSGLKSAGLAGDYKGPPVDSDSLQREFQSPIPDYSHVP